MYKTAIFFKNGKLHEKSHCHKKQCCLNLLRKAQETKNVLTNDKQNYDYFLFGVKCTIFMFIDTRSLN